MFHGVTSQEAALVGEGVLNGIFPLKGDRNLVENRSDTKDGV